MSLSLRDGFLLHWMSNGPYPTREACPADGKSHRDCGLVWCSIPGVPKGRIEIRPAAPHRKDSCWEYTIIAPPREKVVGCGLKGLLETQHAMLDRVPDLLLNRPWVLAKIEVTEAKTWRAKLIHGPATKEFQGGPEGEQVEALLAAAKALFSALKRPVKIAITESTGKLRLLYDEGYWPGKGSYGLTMHEIDRLSEVHYVRVVQKGREK